ncbi:MAG: hypothetical protein R3E41_02175 [Burkholderiaceae bacterium]
MRPAEQIGARPRRANARLARWFDANVLSLEGRDMRLSYLPPLMVYMASGISGLTAIVGTFFVKGISGCRPSFSPRSTGPACPGRWMPLGHLVDLVWRYKAWLVSPRRDADPRRAC